MNISSNIRIQGDCELSGYYSSDEEEDPPVITQKQRKISQVKTVQQQTWLKTWLIFRYATGFTKSLTLRNIQSHAAGFPATLRAGLSSLSLYSFVKWPMSVSLLSIIIVNRLALRYLRSHSHESDRTQSLASQNIQQNHGTSPKNQLFSPLLFLGLSILLSLPILLRAFIQISNQFEFPPRDMLHKLKQTFSLKQLEPELDSTEVHGFKYHLSMAKWSLNEHQVFSSWSTESHLESNESLYTRVIPDYLVWEEMQRRLCKAQNPTSFEENYRRFMQGDKPSAGFHQQLPRETMSSPSLNPSKQMFHNLPG